MAFLVEPGSLSIFACVIWLSNYMIVRIFSLGNRLDAGLDVEMLFLKLSSFMKILLNKIMCCM